MSTKNKTLVELIEYTDPYCTWCWGSEPILKRIKETYGDQINIRYRMGGLVADISSFYDSLNQIGGPSWHTQVAAHWLEASGRHGMPVDERIFYDLKDEFRSTYPASIAYKAAEFQDVELAKKFLRRMREAASAERIPIHRLDVQEKLAQEVGLEKVRFHKDIEGGEAEKAFQKDLAEAHSRGITGFPTFLIRGRSGDEIVLHGYQGFENFQFAFRKLAGNTLETNVLEPTDGNILDFIRKYGKVAFQEVSEVFDLPRESVKESLRRLKTSAQIKELKSGNGFFYLA
jgi:predicted DsbA family dithiol-disulfide isomerase